MKKITKKELKKTIESAITNALKKLDLVGTSKKTKKAIARVAKTLKSDLKEKTKKASKKNEKLVKAKAPRKNKTKKKATPPPALTNNSSDKN